MKVEFSKKFLKELDKIDNTKIHRTVKALIEEVKDAESPSEIPKLKKLKGYNEIYRGRVGEYRIGLIYAQKTLSFETILHRKDIYKKFP